MEKIVIENVMPEVNNGEFPVKRVEGEPLEVRADIFKGEVDIIRASLKYRPKGDDSWSETPMSFINEDRWRGSFTPNQVGRYEYTIEAWADALATMTRRIERWISANEDISSDLSDLVRSVRSIVVSARGTDRKDLTSWLSKIADASNDKKLVLELLTEPNFVEMISRYLRSSVSEYKILEMVVDPKSARFATWYEMFHRSQGQKEGHGATFRDCELRLQEIKDMGFDTIYLPPIHPIGHKNRRGRNNAGPAQPGEPGSPWAIGNEQGGHKAINPELGTIGDFRHFVESARNLGMEVALDIAFQCSPDHPYVKEHPEWFSHRSDGTIRYAENPPKRYYDIYPLCFDCENSKALWEELLSVFLFWIDNGVNVFRVDNPHTKPFDFWRWLIARVKEASPEAVFLSEAFTRPAVMKYLAKIGFTESYTYFTWKNTKWELSQLMEEFVLSNAAEYYRGNFFTNTPDILNEYLQKGGRPAFKIRLLLAATLSSVYGIYNGFELCENRAREPHSEEYLDSEKYQYKTWDWNRPGNIKDFITKINHMRQQNPALQQTRNLRLLRSDNENIFFYGKWTSDLSNIILVAVNLDPFNTHDSTVFVPAYELGLSPSQTYAVRDLITGTTYRWKGEANYVKLDPSIEPAHILLLQK